MKECVLKIKLQCDNCGECMRCDIDKNKICDNCMKCVIGDNNFISVKIDSIEKPNP